MRRSFFPSPNHNWPTKLPQPIGPFIRKPPAGSPAQLPPLSLTFQLPGAAGLLAAELPGHQAWSTLPFSPSKDRSLGQSPGKDTVWHEGSVQLLSENSVPRIKFLLGDSSAQLCARSSEEPNLDDLVFDVVRIVGGATDWLQLKSWYTIY